jgi:Tfp pilus assembly protein PilX
MPALSPASFIVTSGRPRRKPSGTGSRGSVLIVALMICALIALTLGSYLSLNLNSTRQAKRAFHNSAALNLAEAGAEEAVWSFNRATAGHDNAWTGWSDDGTAAWRKFTGFDFAANTTGSVKVYATTTNPPPDPSATASLLADLQADAASLASAWVAAAADLTDAVAHASAATSSHVGAWDAAADRFRRRCRAQPPPLRVRAGQALGTPPGGRAGRARRSAPAAEARGPGAG